MQAGATGLIGPNAILQLVPVLEAQCGAARMRDIFAQAALSRWPDGLAMIPQEDAARVHQAVREAEPEHARAILRAAGERTAANILAHRIPRIAQIILKILPAPFAARILSRAIAQHAWTFTGSGQFRAVTAWHFEIAHNPLIAGERNALCLCVWHDAVFETLYRNLVSPHVRCIETTCGAQTDDCICRFTLTKR